MDYPNSRLPRALVNEYTNWNSLSDTNNLIKQKKFEDRLISHSFSGNWTTNDKLFDFDNKQGLVRLLFQNYMIRGPRGSYYNFILFIHDGYDKDKWLYFQNTYPMPFNDNSTFFSDGNQTQIKHKNLQVNMIEMSNMDLVMKRYERLDFNFTSFEYSSNEFVHSRIFGNLYGSIYDIKINFYVDQEKESLYRKISNFAMIMTIISALQLVNSKHLMDKFADNEVYALKVKKYFKIIIYFFKIKNQNYYIINSLICLFFKK